MSTRFWTALALMCTACTTSPHIDSTQLAAEGLPDLVIDEPVFEASVRAETRQRVQQAEVDQGCAQDTDDRTLVRFDLRINNTGQGDVSFGKVSCTSTNPQPECFGRDCNLNPTCCCGGSSLCTTVGGGSSDFFEFSCAHREAVLRVGAQVELLDDDRKVVRKRLHGIMLRDHERTDEPTDCDAPGRHGFGEMGLSATCASLQPASVGCQYVDATGLPPGDYSLRVTLNPFLAIPESEFDNTAVFDVTLDPAPPSLERSRPVYLVCYGDGTREEALSYYDGLSPGGFAVGQYSLDDWIDDFMDGRPQVDFLYRNANDLGFWREMHCTTSVGRNQGGCWVRNWAEIETFEAGTPNLGTVAMRVDKDGITQFFVFGPDGTLAPEAILDDEGAKFVPRLCVNCHGGTYRGDDEVDLGSTFREFEPDVLERRDGFSLAEAQTRFRLLNEAVKTANLAVRSEAEGAPFGTDDAKDALARYMADMYPTPNGEAIAITDGAHVPASWRNGHSDQQRRLNEDLYRRLVNPYCQGCHRNNLINWESYSLWSTLGPPFGALRGLLVEDPDDPDRENQIFMPQAKLAWKNLMGDAEALIAIERWLAYDEDEPRIGGPGPSADERDFARAHGLAHNSAPRAISMHPESVAPREVVILDARRSFDPNGHKITTEWLQIYGPPTVLFNASTDPEVRFVAPPSQRPTSLGFLLTVRDSKGEVDERIVDIEVHPSAEMCADDASDDS